MTDIIITPAEIKTAIEIIKKRGNRRPSGLQIKMRINFKHAQAIIDKIPDPQIEMHKALKLAATESTQPHIKETAQSALKLYEEFNTSPI
jgi:hypothetical protein